MVPDTNCPTFISVAPPPQATKASRDIAAIKKKALFKLPLNIAKVYALL